jgi:hypothetical protein
MRRYLLIALLASTAVALQPFAPAHRRHRVALPSSPDDDDIGVSLESMNAPSVELAKLQKEMDEAQAAGDTMAVIEIMGTMLSMSGGNESEAGEDVEGTFESRGSL